MVGGVVLWMSGRIHRQNQLKPKGFLNEHGRVEGLNQEYVHHGSSLSPRRSLSLSLSSLQFGTPRRVFLKQYVSLTEKLCLDILKFLNMIHLYIPAKSRTYFFPGQDRKTWFFFMIAKKPGFF